LLSLTQLQLVTPANVNDVVDTLPVRPRVLSFFNAPESAGFTTLHHCVFNCNIECAEWLLTVRVLG
jgi:hypothetical protein